MFLSVSGVHTHDLHLPSAIGPTNALNYSFVQKTCTQGPSEVFFQQCVLGQSWTSTAAQALYQAAGFGQATVAPGGCPANSSRPGFSGTFFAPYTNFGCDYGASGLALRGFLPFPMFNWYLSGPPINITSKNGTFNGTPLAYTPQFNTPNFVAAGGFNVNWSGADYHPSTTPAFNPNKFQFPGAWTIGNAAPLYNGLRFPAYYDEDLSLTKRFFFGERFSGELTMQFFNVFNRILAGACRDTNVGDTKFVLNTQPRIPW